MNAMSAPRTVRLNLLTITQYPDLYLSADRHGGLGVFTVRPVRAGGIAMSYDLGDWYDPLYSWAEVQALGLDPNEELIQVDEDAFVARGGMFDDFVNHCCAPSMGLRLTPWGYEFVALRDIEAHEELTWDYATYWDHTSEPLRCGCGAASCRGVTNRFSDMPVASQERYLRAGLVPPFIAERYGQALGLPPAKR